MPPKYLKNTGPMFPGFATCEIAERTTSHPLISLPVDSPAKILAMQDSERVFTESAADYGSSSHESFAIFNLDTFSWRTSQLCLTGEWATFSERWPLSGTMQNGQCYL